MTDLRKALEPCPFCGGADVELGMTETNWPTVCCSDCGTQGPCTDLQSEKAAEAWNNRAALAPSRPVTAGASPDEIAQEAEALLANSTPASQAAGREAIAAAIIKAWNYSWVSKKLALDAADAILALGSKLTPQDAKAVAVPAAWGRVIDGQAVTVSREWTRANSDPLYASPVDRAAVIEDCAKVAESFRRWIGGDDYSNAFDKAGIATAIRALALPRAQRSPAGGGE